MEKMEMLRQLTEQIDMEKVQDLYRRFKAGEINQADYEAQVRSLVEKRTVAAVRFCVLIFINEKSATSSRVSSWRRGWDLNPRDGVAAYLISSQAPSASSDTSPYRSAHLHQTIKIFYHNGKNQVNFCFMAA